MNNLSAKYSALALLLLILCGCSSIISSPAATDIPTDDVKQKYPPGRIALGAWHILYFPGESTISVVPIRDAHAHFNVTGYLIPPGCTDCVIIKVLQYKPVQKEIVIGVTLKNPTQLTARDVRGIMMTENPDIRLINADSYTSLWDNGWDLTINPFKAFAVDMPQRKFEASGSYEREYEIGFPSLDDVLSLYLVFDASWPSNCKEPYEVRNPHATGTFLDFAEHDIQCEVLGWNDDIESVSIDLGCIGRDVETPMSYQGDGIWMVEDISWHYGGEGPGTYPALITTKCAGSNIPTHNYADLTIDASPPSNGWARVWGSVDSDNAHRVEIDVYGNIFVSGDFSETVDFDPGTDVEEYSSNGEKDAFVSKFNSVGNHLWTRTFGSIDNDICYGLDTDAFGAVFLSGSFRGEADFDPGPVTNIHAPNGVEDAYVAKFSADGDFEWAHTWGGDDSVFYDFSHALAVDGNDNVYVTGKVNGTIDFDPGPEVDERTSAGLVDAYIVKFDNAGNYQWARTYGGPGEEKVKDIVIDSNNIYVTGLFQLTTDFDPGPGVEEHTSAGHYDIYLSKFTPDGDFVWTRCWGGAGGDVCWGMALSNFGGIYITGYFQLSVDFDPGPGVDEHESSGFSDIFLCVLDLSGGYHGCITWGGPNDYEYGYDVKVDGTGNIYVTGTYMPFTDFDPGPGIEEYQTTGSGDAFLCKFTPTGGFKWVRPWGGGTSGSWDFAYGVAMDTDGFIYASGGFLGSADFHPGPGLDKHTSHGGFDAFLCKFKPDGMW